MVMHLNASGVINIRTGTTIVHQLLLQVIISILRISLCYFHRIFVISVFYLPLWMSFYSLLERVFDAQALRVALPYLNILNLATQMRQTLERRMGCLLAVLGLPHTVLFLTPPMSTLN